MLVVDLTTTLLPLELMTPTKSLQMDEELPVSSWRKADYPAKSRKNMMFAGDDVRRVLDPVPEEVPWCNPHARIFCMRPVVTSLLLVDRLQTPMWATEVVRFRTAGCSSLAGGVFGGVSYVSLSPTRLILSQKTMECPFTCT